MVAQPAKIGKYDVIRVIGRGGMGVVYEALDPKLGRHVAIKMILGATPGLVARFDREARSTGGLQHQNIVTIYEFGDQEGSPYLVMEYLEGMSLDAAISSGQPLSLASKLSICVDVCNGLSYAHDRGIIHRDIKPGNVMLLEDGNVKIVDFGIARIGDSGISRTEVIGSLHYMSPEQFQSQPLDRRTDIFSTGVVLYQLLTGDLPFQATGGEAAVMYRIIHEDPPPLSSYLQDYPPELDQIIGKALAKNRDLRYPSARDFAFDLLAVAEKEKHQEVLQWMKRADTAAQRTEWTKAEDCLRQVLRVDKHHTPAHQLLSQVQLRIRQQRNVDQVRQLRSQADEAFLNRSYDEALRILDQAIAIDDTNEDLLSLRQSIQEAKSQAARLKSALRRAEEAHHAGDLDEAKLAVREALEIDPYETSAKALQVVILKQLEERERQLRLRRLLDNARNQIAARDLNGAFRTLKEAELVDSTSVDLYSLMKVVNAAREEQFRKLEMEKLTREIEEALHREDYAAATAIAIEGLQRYPREPGLLKMKVLAETEQQRVQLKTYARDQFLAANGLVEAGKASEALALIENALRTVPGDVLLERLRGIVKDRLASDEAEERKRQLLGRAQELAAAEKFDDAVRLLESVQRDFAASEEIETLLKRTRAAAKHAETVAQALDRAQQLLRQDSAEQAVRFLEERSLEVSDARLLDLLDSARRQQEQFQSGLQSAMEESKRILGKHGALEAARYLAAQPVKFRDVPEFRALAETLASRMAWEALDQGLMDKTDPDSQVRLAEAALRANPGNEEIKKRLATVLSRKEQINAIAEKARVLEASRQYNEAAKELQQLRQLYPQYPSLESEIRRLERLQEQRLMEAVRLEREQFQLGLQSAINEGNRILQKHAASEAAKYLATQSVKYRETPEFRAFAEVVAQRMAGEALDRDLAGNADLDAQLHLAEAALRQNPGSEEIQKRLAAVRQRKEQINAIAEKARVLEASGQFGEAAKELQRLRQVYPQDSSLVSEIGRLQGLDRQRLSEEARRQQEQFHAALQSAIDEGKRILQKQGSSEAAKYLGSQPAKYREIPEYKAFAEMVAEREAWEALDQELAVKTDPDTQVRVAEAALRKNPRNEEIKKRLAAVRSRSEQINAIAEKVRGLEGSRQYSEAAKELQQLRMLYPLYPGLESELRRMERLEEQRLLEGARREREQFQLASRSAIEEGNRILQKQGASKAAVYLGRQSAKYRETPEFRAFAEIIAKRLAFETLERELASNPDPDTQVRETEAALRENPGSEDIKKRLVAVRSRKQQISAVAEKARALEGSRQFGKAAKELQRLRQVYPEYPGLELEIRRLEQLQEQSKKPRLRSLLLMARENVDRSEGTGPLQKGSATEDPASPAEHDSATQLFSGPGSTAPPRTGPPAAPIYAPGRPTGTDVQRPVSPPLVTPPARTDAKATNRMPLFIGVGALSLVAMLMVVWTSMRQRAKTAHSALVSVEIVTTPQGASVRVKGTNQECTTPRCRLNLAPGTYEVEAQLSGFETTDRTITVNSAGPNSVEMALNELAAPPKGETPLSPNHGNADGPVRPPPARLQINRATAGAEVLIDGETRGRVRGDGLFSTDVLPGDHKIKLRSGQGESAIITQHFSSGNTLSLKGTDFAPAAAVVPAEQADWQRVMKSQTIEGINQFLRMYPTGAFRSEAENKLEDLYWEKDNSADNPAALRDYLRRYPGGKYLPAANTGLARLDWQAIANTKDPAALENYLRMYSSGEYHDKAYSRLDDLLWERTGRGDDAGSLRPYLQTFPTGRHADQARREMDQLTAPKEAANANPPNRPTEPPRPTTPPTSGTTTSGTAPDDKTAVLSVLSAYEKIYESEDLQGLQRLWPSMTPKQTQGVGDFFKNASSVKLTCIPGSPKIAGTEATLEFKQELMYVMNGTFQKPSRSKVNMKLKKAPQGTWLIDSIH